MKINIASTRRFHLLNLAKELIVQGHDVTFYSYVPKKRCKQYGLPSTNCKFLWVALPFIFLEKIFPKNKRIIYFKYIFIDYYLAFFMKKCQIFICLGSVYKKSITIAQKRKSITILEWGSKHIIEQLNCFNRLKSYPHYFLNRELSEYEIVDYISIPSTHVKESFIKHNIPLQKLVINPYGVDLSQFKPTTLIDNYDLIFVGGWRYEKGSDLLIELCTKYKYRLLHVGTIINLAFPRIENMTHIDSVDQKQLIHYYSKAKVFVLPSRAEGLALVQAQAMACGLPVVCSKETGGSDLNKLIGNKEWIIEMNELTVEELNRCVKYALSLAQTQTEKRDYIHNNINDLSWKAYGIRYDNFIRTKI